VIRDDHPDGPAGRRDEGRCVGRGQIGDGQLRLRAVEVTFKLRDEVGIAL
jgi:hypothetical protein